MTHHARVLVRQAKQSYESYRSTAARHRESDYVCDVQQQQCAHRGGPREAYGR